MRLRRATNGRLVERRGRTAREGANFRPHRGHCPSLRIRVFRRSGTAWRAGVRILRFCPRRGSCDHHDDPSQSAEVPAVVEQRLSALIFLERSHQVLPHSRLVRRSGNSRALVMGAQNVLHVGTAAQPREPFPPDPPLMRTSMYSPDPLPTSPPVNVRF